MKKLISVVMSIVLILSIIPINVFAIENDSFGGIDVSQYTDSELDLTQYTMNDIVNMTADEYLDLVAEFERVYNPYNSYVETEVEFDDLSMTSIGDETISPQWSSGKIEDEEYTESGCHEYISSVACGILINDKGFFANNATASVVIALLISLASLLPDQDERGTPLYVFDGHFYDPDSNENYHGETTNTAKTNAVAHYQTAVEAARDGNMDAAYEHLGRCLHYVQDANEPHHASNVHAFQIPYGVSHGVFETFAFENQESYLGEYHSIASSNYTNAAAWGVDRITHEGAVEAKPMIQHVRNILNQDDWPEYAKESMENAARYSTMILYKFGIESVVPFYSN